MIGDASGRTLLHHVAIAGRIDLVLHYGSRPGARFDVHDAAGHTPSKTATAYGYTECARALREMAQNHRTTLVPEALPPAPHGNG